MTDDLKEGIVPDLSTSLMLNQEVVEPSPVVTRITGNVTGNVLRVYWKLFILSKAIPLRQASNR